MTPTRLLLEHSSINRTRLPCRERLSCRSVVGAALILLSVACFLCEFASAAPMPEFRALATDGSAYLSEDRAPALSLDGSAVVGSDRWAWEWDQNRGVLFLDVPMPFTGSVAHASNRNGVYVAGAAATGPIDATTSQAVRWRLPPGGYVSFREPLGDLPGGAFDSMAYGISGDGSVVVGVGASQTGREAFRWTPDGGMIGLGNLSGWTGSSAARGVAADGLVIVGSASSPSGQQAFRWTEQTGMVGLGALPGGVLQTTALAVSADGSTIVGWGLSAQVRREAYRWTATSGMIGLGPLTDDDVDTLALAVSGDGSRIVGQSGNYHAFLWDIDRGMQDLQELLTDSLGVDLTGWQLMTASGISEDGLTITGYGFNAGRIWSWRAVIPEPASLLLFAVGGAALRMRRRF